MKTRTLIVLALTFALGWLLVGAVSNIVLADSPDPRPVVKPSEEVNGMSQADKAKIQSCYGSAQTINRSFTANSWTGWYNRTTTSNCADLNVAVTNYGCYVYVDAQYYKKSEGRWVDGAHDDVWMAPGYWYTPITNLADGTQVRVRFYPQCTDSSVTLWLAY